MSLILKSQPDVNQACAVLFSESGRYSAEIYLTEIGYRIEIYNDTNGKICSSTNILNIEQGKTIFNEYNNKF